MKINIFIFLSSIIFTLSSCKKEDLFVSCDVSVLSEEDTKDILLGKWELIGDCEEGEILSLDDHVIWEITEAYHPIPSGIYRQLHLIETTNNAETRNESLELIKSDYMQFFFVENVPYPKRLDICDNEFTLKYINRQGKIIWAKHFERIQ